MQITDQARMRSSRTNKPRLQLQGMLNRRCIDPLSRGNASVKPFDKATLDRFDVICDLDSFPRESAAMQFRHRPSCYTQSCRCQRGRLSLGLVQCSADANFAGYAWGQMSS